MMEDNGSTEEKIDEAAEAVEDDHAGINGSPSGDWVLTDSQYAQVVFDDVADIVGDDPVPHVCRFRISPLLRAEPGDMVAIYRVPNVAPHEYTNYVDVDHTEAEDHDKGRRVVFDPVNLPKEEDFYQFQYVRGGNQVLGASIPFQRKFAIVVSPREGERSKVGVGEASQSSPEEDEFFLVKSMAAEKRYMERVQDMEDKYTELLAKSEKLNEDLSLKSASVVALDEKYRSLLGVDERLQQIKEDMKVLLDARIAAEQDSTKTRAENAALRKRLDQAQSRTDFLQCSLQKKEAEVRAKAEEAEAMGAKNTSLAREAGGSSELVMTTLGNLLGMKKDQKDYQSIFNEVRRLKKEHETLLDVVDGMKRENDELIARNSIEENGSNIEKAHVASLETALEEHVKAQSELYEILNLQERQRTVEYALDVITRMKSSEVAGKSEDDGDLPKKISSMEHVLEDMRDKLAENAEGHSEEIRMLKEEIEGLKLSPYSSSAASSTRNLSSFVIESAVGESGGDCDLSVGVRILDNPVVTQPTSGANGPSHRVSPPSSGPYRAISPHIPCSPPTQARAPFMNAQRVMHNVLPQFPGSIVTPQQQQHHSNVGAKAASSAVGAASSTEKDEDDEEEAVTFFDLRAWAMSKRAEKSDPEETLESGLTESEDPVACSPALLRTNASEPPLVSNPSEPIGIVPEVETEPSDSEPVDLSTRSRDSTPPVSGSFTLTDDGKPVPAEKLECPVCGKEFEENNIRELEFHVDAHLATSRTCPICPQRFDARNEDGFKKHVDDHFAAEEFAMVDPQGSVTFSPRETALQAGSNAFNRMRNFLDFD